MNIEQLVSHLKYNIPNKDIFDNIITEIRNYYEIDELKIETTEEEINVSGNNKDNNDFLNLKLSPGHINFKVSRWNGKNIERLDIHYDNYKATIVFRSTTKGINLIDLKNIDKIYNNYELICSRELSRRIYINNEDKFEYTEINRVGKNSAIRKDIRSTSHSLFNTSYKISNDYNAPYFDDSKNNRRIHIPGYHRISAEEYNKLLNEKQKTIIK